LRTNSFGICNSLPFPSPPPVEEDSELELDTNDPDDNSPDDDSDDNDATDDVGGDDAPIVVEEDDDDGGATRECAKYTAPLPP
jgi:hypothetical protein